MALIINPLIGDRSTFDMGFPERHASDLADNTPVYHVPTGLIVGDALLWNGTFWESSELPPATGGSEVLMEDGVTFPPVPLTTEDGTDWLYAG